MKGLLLAALLAVPGPWSLQDCIDYALEHNITLRQNRISVEQKEIALDNAQARRLPGLSAGSSQNFSFGRGLTADNTYANTNTTSTSFSLGTDIPIFQGFDITNGIKMSRLDLEAATVDLERARDDIRVAVAQAFIQILYNKEISRVAQNQLAVDSLQTVRVEALRMTGRASEAEVAAQRASSAQTRLSAVQAQNNLKLSLLELSQLLELESPEGFDIQAPDESSLGLTLLMDPDEIYADAVGVKPVIRSEEIRLKSAEIAIERAKGGFLPSISLSGGLGTNYYTSKNMPKVQSFGEQIKNNFSQYIGLSLNVPIFSRFQNRNQLRNARLSYDTQQLQLENAKKSLYKEIQQAYYNAVAAQAKYASSNEAAASAEQSFSLTREKYENGKANILEYNEARNRYLEAESNLLQARYECLYQSRLLDFYRGRGLSF